MTPTTSSAYTKPPVNLLRPRQLVLACLLALGLELASIRPVWAQTGTPGNRGNIPGGGFGSNPTINDGGHGGLNATGSPGLTAPFGGSGGGFLTGGGGGASPGGGSGGNGGGFGLGGWLVGGGGGAGGGLSSSGLGGGGGGGGSVNSACTGHEICLGWSVDGAGGGGGGGLGKVVSGSYTNASLITGGAGGDHRGFFNTASCLDDSGLRSGSRSGGGGGGGGAGALLSPGAILTTSGIVRGGYGGSGFSDMGDDSCVHSGPATNAGAGGGGGGGAGVLMSPGSTLLNTGIISGGLGGGGASGGYGGAGVFAAGNATMVNGGGIEGGAGANAVTLTGGGNTLELNAGYAFTGNVISDGGGAGDTLALGGAGNAVFRLEGVGSQYQGFARFEKTGTSTWQAINVASQATMWTIGAGTLSLGGTLAAGSSATVMSGGTLSGTGVVNGTVTVNSGGMLAPGIGVAPTGSLTTSSLVLNAGGTLGIAADGAGNSRSVVLTSGSATLAGNLSVTFSASPAAGQTYTILSGGTVVGTFAMVSATGLTSGHDAVPTYGPSSVTLGIGQPPAITSVNATTFIAGTASSFALGTTGLPAPACSSTGALPSGITFNTATCTLSGSSLAMGTYPLTFTASNGVGSDAAQSFMLTVGAATSFTGPTTTGTGAATATFTGGGAGCTFTGTQFIDVAAVANPPPGGANFPHGLFNFSTQGCTVGGELTITITYPQALPAGAVLLKYGRTSANPVTHWYTHPATIAGNTVTYRVTDGGQGDEDLAQDGSITDPAGVAVFAFSTAGVQAVPTLDRWAMLLLGALVWIIGVVRRKRT